MQFQRVIGVGIAVACCSWFILQKKKKKKGHEKKGHEKKVLLRDFVGYGKNQPDTQWPNGAKIAINFVVNYEEGSEPSIHDGDGFSCASLCECSSDTPFGTRDLAAETMFEYGSRCGFWRVINEFKKRSLPCTISGCAIALQRNHEAVEEIKQCGFDILCHGLRWEEHFLLSRNEEREHISQAMKIMTSLFGESPVGWYCRTAPSESTRELILEHGGFLYDSDAYNDDLPYWVSGIGSKGHLVIPYSLSTNDSKFPRGIFGTSEDYFMYMKDTFDVLYDEGMQGKAKLMNVGLHLRLIGHPARFKGLQKFLDYIKTFPDVWVAKRVDIANYWIKHHPYVSTKKKKMMRKQKN